MERNGTESHPEAKALCRRHAMLSPGSLPAIVYYLRMYVYNHNIQPQCTYTGQRRQTLTTTTTNGRLSENWK